MLKRVRKVIFWSLCALVPAFGQAADLVGVWLQQEEGVTLRFDLAENGTFTVGVSGQIPTSAFLDADNPLVALDLELPQNLVFGGQGNGTWSADSDNLIGETQVLDLTVNDQEANAFFAELAQSIASQIAEALNIPQDDRAQFEQTIIEQVDFSAFFNAASFENFSGSYTLDGDRLVVVDTDGQTTEWIRQVTQSAVAPISWGYLKARRGF